MIYIHHLTLDTGHLGRSRRSDVDDAVVTVVAQDLAVARAGEAYVIRPGYTLDPATADGVLLATVMSEALQAPLVTIGVARDSRRAARLWRLLEEHFGDVPPRPGAPVCVVKLHPGLAADLAATAWLGDYERCLAWAWIEGLRR